MAVTSADVARHAGFSRATVSQILNGYTDRFAEETTRRVLQAADELQYEPSAVGRMLRSGSSDFIVALIPNTTFGGNLQDIFDAVTELLAEHGLGLVLHFSNQSPSSLDRIIGGIRPRAVLSLQPFTPNERQILLDRNVPGFDTDIDGDRNYDIGLLQAQHLIDRGFRRLAFAHLSDLRADPFGAGREQAVVDACAIAGMSPPEILDVAIDHASADSGLSRLGPGTGIVCYNDDVAITLMTAAGRRGWRIPEDVGLIGMDNTPLGKVMNPQLTTVGYSLTAVARASANAALHAIGQAPAASRADLGLQIVDGGTC